MVGLYMKGVGDVMNSYRKIKKELLHSLEDSYYVIITFMSADLPLELSVHKEVPTKLLLSRIKYILILYDKIFNKKITNIIIDRSCISLTTRIFIEVKNG